MAKVLTKFAMLREATLPIISCSTRDTIHVRDVLRVLVDEMPTPWEEKTKIDENGLYYFVVPKGTRREQMPDLDKTYQVLQNKSATLFVVNPPIIMDVMFDAGEVPVPRSMMFEAMEDLLGKEKAKEMLPALGGVTLKEATEYAKITMVRDKSLTPQGMVLTRKSFFSPQAGLTLVDAHQDFYMPDKKLAEWIGEQKQFFLAETIDFRLRPRGLLFDGPPGVGKTAGAKYIAEQWGVPMYRFDVATTQNKWLGETEANMQRNLDRLDHEEPCVALFDEVEKIFSKNQFDGGYRQTLMSQLLWWLAERRSRVLVIMTTNKSSVIPNELYRERRIDQAMVFPGLDEDALGPFLKEVFDTFKIVPTAKMVMDMSKKLMAGQDFVAQAAATEAVIQKVKAMMLTGGAGNA